MKDTTISHDPSLKVRYLDLKEYFKDKILSSPHVFRQGIVRIETVLGEPSFDILAWLTQQKSSHKIYWRDRNGSWEMGSIGGADIISGDSLQDIPKVLREIHTKLSGVDDQVRYFGGHAFSPLGQGLNKAGLPAYMFVLPRFQICRNKTKFYSICHWLSMENPHNVVNEISQLNWDQSSREVSQTYQTVSRQDNPDRDQWGRILEKVLGALNARKYQKLVLARQSIFELVEPACGFDLLGKLQSHTPQCFHFAFQSQNGECFLGASPELLFRRSGQKIESEAVAGTRPRSNRPKDDEAFSEELMNSPKEHQEHELVVDAIRQTLQKFCINLDQGNKTLLKYPWGQHLVSLFYGTLKSSVSDADLLVHLHPTPAVGSFPTEQAYKLLKEIEPFDRLWYAAPVGWIGRDQSEFIVAIRSAFVDRRKVLVFAGAGILPDSDVEGEWNEVENKIGPFKKIFSR